MARMSWDSFKHGPPLVPGQEYFFILTAFLDMEVISPTSKMHFPLQGRCLGSGLWAMRGHVSWGNVFSSSSSFHSLALPKVQFGPFFFTQSHKGELVWYLPVFPHLTLALICQIMNQDIVETLAPKAWIQGNSLRLSKWHIRIFLFWGQVEVRNIETPKWKWKIQRCVWALCLGRFLQPCSRRRRVVGEGRKLIIDKNFGT